MICTGLHGADICDSTSHMSEAPCQPCKSFYFFTSTGLCHPHFLGKSQIFAGIEYNNVECFYKASHLTGTRNHRDIVDCMVGRARDTAKFFRVGKCLTRRMAKLCQKQETWIDVHTDWRRGSIGKQ